MSAIKVKTHIESDTLRLKQLKPLIGKDVEISVRTAKSGIVVTIRKTDAKAAKKSPRKSKTGWFTRNFGVGRDADFEGFDEAREKWRQEDLARNDRLKDLPE